MIQCADFYSVLLIYMYRILGVWNLEILNPVNLELNVFIYLGMFCICSVAVGSK